MVTLTAEDGTVFTSGDASTWRGNKGFSLTQNFGLKMVPYGTYKVSITGYTDYVIAPDSQLQDGGTLTITGYTPNKFINFIKTSTGKPETAEEPPAYDLDADDDNDGLPNGRELELGTDPAVADSDNDGINDDDEIAAGTNPLVADKKPAVKTQVKRSVRSTKTLPLTGSDALGAGAAAAVFLGLGSAAILSARRRMR